MKFGEKRKTGESIEEFFSMCGKKVDGTKVLWLFVRDFLKLPAFPIDRWVKRNLQSLGLPLGSWTMIKICQDLEIDPNKINRLFFHGTNPDWNVS